MKSPIIEYRKLHGPNLVILTCAKTIDEDDIKTHSKWKTLKEWYISQESKKETQWIDKAGTSVINAIIYQERKAFCITKDKLKKLLKNDSNWKIGISLSNNKIKDKNTEKEDTYYRTLLAYLTKEWKIIELVQEGGRGIPSVYKVIDQDILKTLENTTMADQLKECIDFAGKPSKNNNLNTWVEPRVEPRVTESKKDRKVESEPPIDTDNQITFEQLLWKQYPNSYFGGSEAFDNMAFMAQLAVEKCADFYVGKYALQQVKNHLLSVSINPSSNTKNYIDKLVKKFDLESKRHYNLLQVQDVDLGELTEIKNTAIKQAVENEDVVQNNTLNILKATFGKEKIKKLKGRLATIEDEEEKYEIEMEIAYLEKA